MCGSVLTVRQDALDHAHLRNIWGFVRRLPWRRRPDITELVAARIRTITRETSTYVVVRSLDCATLFLFLASFPPKSLSVIRLFLGITCISE